MRWKTRVESRNLSHDSGCLSLFLLLSRVRSLFHSDFTIRQSHGARASRASRNFAFPRGNNEILREFFSNALFRRRRRGVFEVFKGYLKPPLRGGIRFLG